MAASSSRLLDDTGAPRKHVTQAPDWTNPNIGMVALIELIQIWGALALVRGWKEHRKYLALLRSLPQES